MRKDALGNSLALVVFGLTAGCANRMSDAELLARYPPPILERPAWVDEKFQAMLGQSVEVAIKDLGPPASSYAQRDGRRYTWDLTSYYTFRSTEYVETGRECASQVVGMTPGGNGIAPMPIYNSSCRPVGHNQEVQKLGASTPCFIRADTDKNDILTKFDLSSC